MAATVLLVCHISNVQDPWCFRTTKDIKISSCKDGCAGNKHDNIMRDLRVTKFWLRESAIIYL